MPMAGPLRGAPSSSSSSESHVADAVGGTISSDSHFCSKELAVIISVFASSAIHVAKTLQQLLPCGRGAHFASGLAAPSGRESWRRAAGILDRTNRPGVASNQVSMTT